MASQITTKEDEPFARLVEVSQEMIAAGVEELRDLRASGETDEAYVVNSIYMAMEYKRLDLAGELPGLFNYLLQKDKC